MNFLETAGIALFVLGILALWIVCPIITAMKGKYGMVALGLLVHPCWAFGAIRIAKPDSLWARRFYDAGKMNLAKIRFPSSAASLPRDEPMRTDGSTDHQA